MIDLGMITLDTVDPRPLSAWWAERLGGEVVYDAEGWFCMVRVPGMPLALGFQKVEEPTPGKNRMHFDLNRSADVDRDTVVAEWTAAGARHIGLRGEQDFSWDVFADPDGNEFCIGDPHE